MVDEKKNELALVSPRDYGLSLVDMATDVEVAKSTMQMIVGHNVINEADKQFFLANTERWNDVSTKTHIWRTYAEKKSILFEWPTTHLKFHQSILECKVFKEQALQLDKEAKITKLEAEELYIDVENIEAEIKELQETLEQLFEGPDHATRYREISYSIKKKDIKLRKKLTNLHEKAMAAQSQENQMLYRMDELRDWVSLQDEMIAEMKASGMTDEFIWDKNKAQETGNFFLFLTKFIGVKQSKDTGEISNLTNLARHYVDESIKNKTFIEMLGLCNDEQKRSLLELGYIQVKENAEKPGTYDIFFSESYI
jgi:tetrahydromethanopterin S-methyltransferase subunit B